MRLERGDPEGWDLGCPRDEREFGMQPPLVPVPARNISRPGLSPRAGNPGGNFGCCHGGSGGVCVLSFLPPSLPAEPGPLELIQVPQAHSRSFFWEKPAHPTWNSKSKVDFGATGILAWSGFIFPLPLPEAVPLEEFRKGKIPKYQ